MSKPMEDTPLVQLIRVGLAKKRWSRSVLAAECGCHLNTVNRWLDGTGEPEAWAGRWGKALGWTPEQVGRALYGELVL
jgi:hypothetical protein